ncbi:DUF397 domain-containing protein [Streptomyces sp. NPDC051162]|uniref:DUF397 domain-containing protein n=1 Tax=Streptomyces sp. NPDC051162 TaxID=3154747 RepID=UPI00341FEFE1
MKSSYSGGTGGDCVEWAPGFAPSGIVPIRDSKTPQNPVLMLPSNAWSSFVSAVRGDTFAVRTT